MTKPVTQWTRAEFETLPLRAWSQDIGRFDSMVILPREELHDSDYLCMEFVAVRDGIPFCRLGGSSDVIHINGIGGLGFFDAEHGDWISPPRGGWSIDCLPGSGLLRIFFSEGEMSTGLDLSSFEIFAHSTINKESELPTNRWQAIMNE